MSHPNPPNPASLFFAAGASQRLLRALMRAAQALGPGLASRLAFALFSTPMPFKKTVSPQVAAPWVAEPWELMGLRLCSWRHREHEAAAASRPRVLLVHGWAGSAQQMRPLAERLWAQGFAPILLDMPAHGHSQGWQTHMPQFVQALHAAAQRFGPLHGIVAHSLGAVAVSHAVARGLPTARLALIACSAPPRQVLGWFAQSFGLGRKSMTQIQQRLERLGATTLETFEPAWLGPRLPQATLLVHDEQDRAAPFAHAQAFAAALPDARLLAVQGLGHRRILGDAAVAQAVAAHLRGEGF
ncbi:pimeloyl-ACP methyl ester carboxylesterase [Paucibacter oligotrophus]|uniref:Pimeloyl-ACP methyl ester carboxylesterase n=1 Tax=Roseateles oligotrophus TaxID=1769250 RepID=A0A840L8E8_9BURK|nr:alpha/beta fold hydrolase [Roseateles oligotrophus]MBB4841667.1 pimeloyl-ACP methyl ester carboxylesterase [Roseateles oligotrophus]